MDHKKPVNQSTGSSDQPSIAFVEGELEADLVNYDDCRMQQLNEEQDIFQVNLIETPEAQKDQQMVEELRESYDSYQKLKRTLGGRPFLRNMKRPLKEFWKTIMPNLYRKLHQLIQNENDQQLLNRMPPKQELYKGKKKKVLNLITDPGYSYYLRKCFRRSDYQDIVPHTRLSPNLRKIYLKNRIPVLCLLIEGCGKKKFQAYQNYYHLQYNSKQQ